MWLVLAITCDRFESESQNLYQICILGFYRLVLKIGVINFDLQGHLAISTENSKKQHSISLLCTDLGRPGVLHFSRSLSSSDHVTCDVLLVIIAYVTDRFLVGHHCFRLCDPAMSCHCDHFLIIFFFFFGGGGGGGGGMCVN